MTIKTDNNKQFYKNMHKTARQKRFPLRAMFELTYRCNFNCLHSYIPASFRKESERKDLKAMEVFSILDQLKEMGCLYLGFTGGEPFAREDFLDILWYAKTKGFEILIYTNGSLIDERIADELKRLKPNKVDITINSLRKEPFERITQTSGSYKRVFKAIDLLHKRNIPLGFKSCVLKENEGDIKDIRKFARSHRGPYRLNDILMPKLDGSKEPYEHRGRLKRKRPFSFKYKETDFSKEIKLPQKRSRSFSCGVGLHNLVINPFGELKMCIHIDYPRYSILESSLKESWQRLKEFADSIKIDENYKCSDCELRLYCRWCPGRAWLEDGSFTSCDPESKRRAEYNYRMAQEKKLKLEVISDSV